jgi:hypothetical protein
MGATAWPREKCTLCSCLGQGLDGHSRASCFVDPESKVFKPEVRTRRLQSCLDKGLKIPQWILDQGHFQARPTTAGKGVSFVTEDEARDMVAALQGAKQVSAEEAESAVEKLMYMSVREVPPDTHVQVIGSIEHLDDGSALGPPDAVNMAISKLTALDRLIKGERV